MWHIKHNWLTLNTFVCLIVSLLYWHTYTDSLQNTLVFANWDCHFNWLKNNSKQNELINRLIINLKSNNLTTKPFVVMNGITPHSKTGSWKLNFKMAKAFFLQYQLLSRCLGHKFVRFQSLVFVIRSGFKRILAPSVDKCARLDAFGKCMWVCVWEREKEREREIKRDKERERETTTP